MFAKIFILSAIVALAAAFAQFESAIPNGARVMKNGQSWPGVGHDSSSGGGPRNSFGLAFKAAGNKWTKELCQNDTDGDGFTNGQELGDPLCIWTPGSHLESRLSDISHPAFRESVPGNASIVNCSTANGLSNKMEWCQNYNASCQYNDVSKMCEIRCSVLTTQAQCSMYSSCMWDKSCMTKTVPQPPAPTTPPPPPPCHVNRDQASCSQNMNCSWNGTACTPKNPNPNPPPQPTVNCTNLRNKTACWSNDMYCQWLDNVNVCVPSCYSIKSASQCSAMSYCEWEDNIGINGGMCNTKQIPPPPRPPQPMPCYMNTNQLNCSQNMNCSWNGTMCTPKNPNPQPPQPSINCTNLRNKTACAYWGNDCQWNAQWETCVPLCYSYKTFAQCSATSYCEWTESSSMPNGWCKNKETPRPTPAPRTRCGQIPDMSECAAASRCQWNQGTRSCRAKPCSAYNGDLLGHCVGNGGCMIKNVSTDGIQVKPYCVPRRCSDLKTWDQCADNQRCWFGSAGCMAVECKNLNMTTCSMSDACTIAMGDSTSSTTGASNYRCVPRGCGQSNDAQCAADPSCDLRAEGTSMKCVQKACSTVDSADQCREPCTWSFKDSKCNVKPCIEYTGMACPISSGKCIDTYLFGASLCVSTSCSGVNSSSVCGEMPGCAFTEKWGCVDSGVWTLPCYRYGTSAACSAPQVAERCVMRDAGSAGVCNNREAKPCFEFGVESCPSFCRVEESVCANPVCEKYTAASPCAEGRCRWAGSSGEGKCMDPQLYEKLPCEKFVEDTCPKQRCNVENGKCVAFGPAPTEAPKQCADFMDTQTCNTAPIRCSWNAEMKKCTLPACKEYEGTMCPEKRCRSYDGICVDPCPATAPFVCDDGLCAANRAKCVKCPTGMVQCIDSTCVESYDQCPCAGGFSRCPDSEDGSKGRCVENTTKSCGVQCAGDLSYRCWNNKCAATRDDCDCPFTVPIKCNVSGKAICVASSSECVRQCPTVTPFRCWDGNCATDEKMCACPPNYWRCPTTKRCVGNLTQCPCQNSNLTRCGKDRCALKSVGCEKVSVCPTKAPFKCTDGSCAATKLDCFCSAEERASAFPEVTIKRLSSRFDITQWLRVSAVVNYTVCGRDMSESVAVEWHAVKYQSGASVSDTTGKARKMKGLAVALPPMFFSEADVAYMLVATAKFTAPGSDEMGKSAATIRIVGFQPAPEVRLIGGDSRVVGTDGLMIGAEVKDRTTETPDWSKSSWVCCKDSECLTSCPDQIASKLTNVKSGNVNLRGSFAAGLYWFTFYYKGISATQRVRMVSVDVPQVRIIQTARDFFVNQEVKLYAAVSYSQEYVMEWWMGADENSLQKLGATSQVLTIDANSLSTARDSVIVARAVGEGAVGNSTVRLRPKAAITGTCTARIIDGSANAEALTTRIRITAEFPSNDDTELTYRFGYMDQSATGETTNYVLSPFFQDLPTLDTLAPMPFGNPESRDIRFRVLVRYGSDKQNVIATVCNVLPIRKPGQTQTVIDAQENELDNAAKNSDRTTLIRAAGSLVSTVANEQDGESKRRVVAKVLSNLRTSLTEDSSTMSTTERRATVQALVGLAKGDAIENQNETEKEALVDVMKNVMMRRNCSASEDEDCNGIDTRESGQEVLEVLKKIKKESTERRELVERLSQDVAKDVQLGERKRFVSGGMSVEGLRRLAADCRNKTVGTPNTTLRTPENFNLDSASETDEVGLSAAEFDENPVGTTGAGSNRRLGSSVVDFSMLVNGQKIKYNNPSEPLEIKMRVPRNATNVTCMYFDENTNMWSTAGIRFKKIEGEDAVFETEHLSVFGVFIPTAPTPVTPPPGPAPTNPNPNPNPNPQPTGPNPTGPSPTNPPGPSPTGSPEPTNGTSPNGAPTDDSGDNNELVAIVVPVVLSVGVIAVVAVVLVRRSQQNAKGTGFREDAVPLNDLHAGGGPGGLAMAAPPSNRTPYDEL